MLPSFLILLLHRLNQNGHDKAKSVCPLLLDRRKQEMRSKPLTFTVSR